MGQKSGSAVGTAIVLGGVAVCCGFHLQLTLGGLAALGGVFTGSPWIVAAGGLVLVVGIFIHMMRRRSSASTTPTSERA